MLSSSSRTHRLSNILDSYLRNTHDMFVLPLIEVCGCGSLGWLNPLEADKSASLAQVNVDLLYVTKLNEERVQISQVVQLVRYVVNDDAESLLLLYGQGRIRLTTRRAAGHLSLQSLNLLQLGNCLLLVLGLCRGITVVNLSLGGLQLLNQRP